MPIAKRFALVPLGPPLLAYSSTSKSMLVYDDEQRAVVLRTAGPVEAGQPVTAWCGPQPNSRLLLNYGLVDEHNPFDKLQVGAAGGGCWVTSGPQYNKVSGGAGAMPWPVDKVLVGAGAAGCGSVDGAAAYRAACAARRPSPWPQLTPAASTRPASQRVLTLPQVLLPNFDRLWKWLWKSNRQLPRFCSPRVTISHVAPPPLPHLPPSAVHADAAHRRPAVRRQARPPQRRRPGHAADLRRLRRAPAGAAAAAVHAAGAGGHARGGGGGAVRQGGRRHAAAAAG